MTSAWVSYPDMTPSNPTGPRLLRVGLAAEMLGVSVDTLRRWEADRRLRVQRSAGRQRLVPITEVTRLLDAVRDPAAERPFVSGSARNRCPGVVTRVERDGVAAVVEVMAGPHRLVSLMTAEAADELALQEGDAAVGVAVATTVIVEVSSRTEFRP